MESRGEYEVDLSGIDGNANNGYPRSTESFGLSDNWCLQLGKGYASWFSVEDPDIRLYLQLLRLPRGVRGVHIKYEAEWEDTDGKCLCLAICPREFI